MLPEKIKELKREYIKNNPVWEESDFVYCEGDCGAIIPSVKADAAGWRLYGQDNFLLCPECLELFIREDE